MKTTMTMKKAQLTAYALTDCFLLIHIAMFLLFWHFSVVPMARFNTFSIAFYLATMVIIHTEKLRLYVVGVYLEVLCHMTLAVFFVGWESGFQITLIGINILLFYAEYVSRSLGKKYIPALFLSLLGMASYMGSFVISQSRPAPYQLPERVCFWLHMAWAVVVFVITIFYLQVFVQITFQSESVLANLVVRDRLTGLHNRYYMSEYLNGVMSGDAARSFWVAMMDIDNFKRVNDTYGHNCGDYVLKSVAEIIQSNCQGTEFCRWGGEEFLVVGRAEESCACACERLDSLRRRVEEYPFCYESQPLHITITIGMARYESGKSVKEWINHADQKLYQGKCSGKNRVVC